MERGTANRVVRQGAMNSHCTSLDVSKMAGVGRATVSRYLNNPQLLSDETRKKVKKAVEVLNYRPSAAARGLVNGKLKIIGFITDIDKSSNQAEYMTAVAEGLMKEKYCLSVSTIPMWTKISEIEKTPFFLQNHVDGFIFNTEYLMGDIRSFCTTFRVPSVFINASEYYPYDCVMPVDISDAEKAVNYLYEKGHRRIAYLGGTVCGLSRAKWFATKMVGLGFVILIFATVIVQWRLDWVFWSLGLGAIFLLIQIVEQFLNREF